MRRRRATFAWSLLAITLAGLAWRVAYVLVARRHMTVGGDAFFYTYGADLVARGKGFIDPFYAAGGQIRQTASHPPLYELWLALASLVKTRDPTVHLVWSCVLGAGTVAVAGLAGREVAGSRAGLLAAAIAAAYPHIWLYDGTLLSETMAIFTTAMVIWLAYRFARQPHALAITLLGVACGLAALSRSELILAIPIVLVPLAMKARAVRGGADSNGPRPVARPRSWSSHRGWRTTRRASASRC